MEECCGHNIWSWLRICPMCWSSLKPWNCPSYPWPDNLTILNCTEGRLETTPIFPIHPSSSTCWKVANKSKMLGNVDEDPKLSSMAITGTGPNDLTWSGSKQVGNWLNKEVNLTQKVLPNLYTNVKSWINGVIGSVSRLLRSSFAILSQTGIFMTAINTTQARLPY